MPRFITDEYIYMIETSQWQQLIYYKNAQTNSTSFLHRLTYLPRLLTITVNWQFFIFIFENTSQIVLKFTTVKVTQ